MGHDDLDRYEAQRSYDDCFREPVPLPKPSELWEILVPTVMGDSQKPVKTRHHKQWDKYVRSLSGGLTILRPAKGQWMCPASKQLIQERMIPVRVACNEEEMQKIIQFTLRHYQQRVVMAYQISNNVLMVERHR